MNNVYLFKGSINRALYNSAAASGWAGWALAHPEFGSSVNPITTRGQIMPTTLLLAHPDLKTQRQLCIINQDFLTISIRGIRAIESLSVVDVIRIQNPLHKHFVGMPMVGG